MWYLNEKVFYRLYKSLKKVLFLKFLLNSCFYFGWGFKRIGVNYFYNLDYLCRIVKK